MTDEVQRALKLDKISISGKAILVAQHSDSSPFIHTFLSHSAKQGRKIVLLTFNESSNYYHNIGTRLGWNSQLLSSRQQYFVIEGLVALKEAISTHSNKMQFIYQKQEFQLKDLYISVKSIVEEKCTNSCFTLIVDGLHMLLYLGVPLNEVVAFYQYCYALMRENPEKNGSLVVSLRVAECDTEVQQFTALLSHWSDLVLNVSGLQTGLSKDLTGIIEIHWNTIPERPETYHFKSYDRGVRMFAPGTSNAVL